MIGDGVIGVVVVERCPGPEQQKPCSSWAGPVTCPLCDGRRQIQRVVPLEDLVALLRRRTDALAGVRVALALWVKAGDPDRVVFRLSDGEPVTASGALAMIDAGDPRMEEFYQDVCGAAVRMIAIGVGGKKA